MAGLGWTGLSSANRKRWTDGGRDRNMDGLALCFFALFAELIITRQLSLLVAGPELPTDGQTIRQIDRWTNRWMARQRDG